MPKGYLKSGEPVKPSFKGRKHTVESRKKIGENSNHSGEKNGMWKGGISSDKKYLSWLKNKRNRMPKVGKHTYGEWETLKAQYNWTCPCCKRKESEVKLTEDHIIPLSKGGSDNIENIQPLCQRCNSKKHARVVKYNTFMLKTRLEMMKEIRDASLEQLIMNDIEMTHGERMIVAMKGQPDSGKLVYDIQKEVNQKAMQSSQRRVAIDILEKMIADEEKNPKPIKDIVNPPVAEEEKPEKKKK
jgi:5-methylcytosine-specific restriction endonuclease McrA